jgi:hypothetical protein
MTASLIVGYTIEPEDMQKLHALKSRLYSGALSHDERRDMANRLDAILSQCVAMEEGDVPDAPRVKCPCCRESLYTAAEIRRGRDSESNDIETTAHQWQCGACGSWNDRKGDTQ